jgi:hypothetical protein
MVLKTTSTGVEWVATSTLGITATGDGVSNWSYNGTRLTPTSTTAGLFVNASSTIGNGTATGGLTISGGATTTGNAYFGGTLGIGVTNPIEKVEVGGALIVDGAGSQGGLLVNNNVTVGPYLASHVNSSGNSTYNQYAARWIASGYGNVFQISPAASAGNARSYTTSFYALQVL